MERLCQCGGRPLHHQGDESGCWCSGCLRRERDRQPRCQHFTDPQAPPQAPDPRLPPEREDMAPPVGRNHPQTAYDAAAAMGPEFATRKGQVLAVIQHAGDHGATDDEIEVALKCTHQGASAARNTLMNEGKVMASARRRSTRHGRKATVWIVVPR